MNHFSKYFLPVLLIWLLFNSCSPKGPVGHVYHNVAAHYNGYFYAKERIREVETGIEEKYDWNYTKVLPIFAQYDTTTSRSFEAQTEDCIKKASVAIQQHPGSKWEDDAYILVGLARMYASQFPEAIETFKYVNTNSEDKDARHRALTYLMRTFVENREMENAVAVSDYLRKKDLSRDNKKRTFLNRAYLYQQRDDLDQMVSNLVEAEKLIKDKEVDSRINFIIGQVYQRLGFDANAYQYYKASLKRSPTYELSFYTKLNMAQVTELTETDDIRKVQRYFKNLLNDPKNLEYKGRIYYEMGDFSLKQGQIREAIGHYKSSVREAGADTRQKAYSYLRLASIHYDSLRDFPLAKAYYDSTITVLPKEEDNYEEVKSRQEILAEFVQHLTTIETNDSLLALSQLSEADLKAFVSDRVQYLKAQDEIRRLEAKEKRKKSMISKSNGGGSIGNIFDEGPTISNDLTGTWYFYNAAEQSRGIAEFQQKWGNRPLEDNWRRSNKSQIAGESDPEESENPGSPEKPEEEEPVEEEAPFDEQAARQQILKEIPKDTATINQLNSEVEIALYELGNIYNFKLEEKVNAVSAFQELLSRYPGTKYAAEVLYQLYLLNKRLNPSLSDDYANRLQSEHPESIYAKLLKNPNYKEENEALNQAFRLVYEQAYRLYEIDSARDVINLVDSAVAGNEETRYTDNLLLLRAMAYGKTEGIYKYQYELNNFIKNNPDSELTNYAKKLVKASEDYQINLYTSSRAKFVKYFEDKHYFILIYNSSPELADKLAGRVDKLIEENGLRLNTGNLVLDEEFAMVLVNEFSGRGSAEGFLSLFQEKIDLDSDFKGQKIYPLIITKDNFDILYETKDLESYLSFFEKNYL